MKLNRFDHVNTGAIILTVLGLILEVAGGIASVPTTVGLNTNLSPILYAGILVIIVGLATAIAGSVMTEKKDMNKCISSIAIYLAVLAVMFALVFVVLTIAWPVINPANG